MMSGMAADELWQSGIAGLTIVRSRLFLDPSKVERRADLAERTLGAFHDARIESISTLTENVTRVGTSRRRFACDSEEVSLPLARELIGNE